MGAFSHIAFAAKSDVGRKRKNNEDAFGVFPSLGIYCVADGMGGGDDGEVASAATVGAVEKFVKAHPLPENAAFPAESMIAGIRAAVNSASKWVYERAKSRNLKGCGSTFVGMCLDPSRPGEATALHAGDSRLYRIRGRGIQQITKDHSAAELIGAKNESELNPMFRGMILRAVGIQPSVEVDATPLPLKEGDIIVICSDGLCRMVPDKKIASIVRDNAAPDAAVEALIAAANEAGGIDNVTAVLVKVGKLPSPLPVVDMPTTDDSSDDGADESSEIRETETSHSFDVAATDDGDAAAFAADTATSATMTGLTSDSSSGSSMSESSEAAASLEGSGWSVMQNPLPEEKTMWSRKRKVVVSAAVAAAVVAAALLAIIGKSDKQPPDDALIDQKAVEEAAKKAAEEAKRKAESEMAAKMAEMRRQIKEAEEKAAKEKAEREAEERRLAEERRAAEESRKKAEAEAARLAAEKKAAEEKAAKEREEAEKRRKAAEELAAKEKAEREAEAKRLEEERQKALEAQKKQQAEADRIAKEKAAAEAKAKREAEEKAKRAAEEKAKREAEAKAKRAAEEKAKREAEAKRLAEEEARRRAAEKAAQEAAAKKAALMQKVRPMLEDADFFIRDNDVKEALKCLKTACDAGYGLPRKEWLERVKKVYDKRVEFLNTHINNRNMAARKNLDPERLKAELEEIGSLFAALRYEDEAPPSTDGGK